MKQLNFKNALFGLLGCLLMLAPLVTAASSKLDAPPAVVSLVVLGAIVLFAAVSKSRSMPNVFANGIEKEIWVNYIIEKLWKNNEFLKFAFSDDDKIVAGKIVHIPQPGASPQVVKNRAAYPAAAVRRTDTDITYVLDEYTTDPTHIANAEQVEVSYDKIDSVLGEHINAVSEMVAEDIIIKWLSGITAEFTIRTSGAATVAMLVGATGNRKSFVHGDLRKAQVKMNKDNVDKNDRYALISEDMYNELFNSLSETAQRDFSRYADAATGVIGRLYGFSILTRSSVAVATSAGAIKALGAAIDVTDCDVALCWQKNAVARALGEVKVFDDTDNPLYFGDIYSTLLRAGGRRRRADNKGVIAIIQDLAA